MFGQGPTSKREFQEAIDEVVLQALENGIPIDNGGYELRHEANTPDIEVLIYTLENPDDDDN